MASANNYVYSPDPSESFYIKGKLDIGVKIGSLLKEEKVKDFLKKTKCKRKLNRQFIQGSLLGKMFGIEKMCSVFGGNNKERNCVEMNVLYPEN